MSDPWEDVTEWCEWAKADRVGHTWKLYHNNTLVQHDDPDYKYERRRVWKREDNAAQLHQTHLLESHIDALKAENLRLRGSTYRADEQDGE